MNLDKSALQNKDDKIKAYGTLVVTGFTNHLALWPINMKLIVNVRRKYFRGEWVNAPKFSESPG